MPYRSNTMRDAAIEATAIGAATKSMQGGAAAGLIGWVAQINWLGLIGAAVAIAGLIVSIYFQRRRDKREQEAHAARMAQFRSGK